MCRKLWNWVNAMLKSWKVLGSSEKEMLAACPVIHTQQLKISLYFEKLTWCKNAIDLLTHSLKSICCKAWVSVHASAMPYSSSTTFTARLRKFTIVINNELVVLWCGEMHIANNDASMRSTEGCVTVNRLSFFVRKIH